MSFRNSAITFPAFRLDTIVTWNFNPRTTPNLPRKFHGCEQHGEVLPCRTTTWYVFDRRYWIRYWFFNHPPKFHLDSLVKCQSHFAPTHVVCEFYPILGVLVIWITRFHGIWNIINITNMWHCDSYGTGSYMHKHCSCCCFFPELICSKHSWNTSMRNTATFHGDQTV